MKHVRIIAWLVLLAWTAGPARAQFQLAGTSPEAPRQAMFAAADPGAPGLWVVLRLEGDRFQLLHRDAGSKPGVLHPALSSPGRPIAVAAGDRQLFLVYDDQSVQSVHVEPDVRTGTVGYRVSQLPPLPAGTVLLDLTANSIGPLALTTPPPPPPEAPSEDDAETESPPEESADQPIEPAPTGPFRLHAISVGRWKPMTTPDDLRAGDNVRVLSVGDDPVIVVNRPDGLTVHRLVADSWQSQHYSDFTLPGAGAQMAAVMGRIVIVAPRPDDPAVLHAQLLHEGQALNAGLLPLPEGELIGWRAVAMDSRLTVIAASSSSQRWVQRDLADAPDTPAGSAELTIAARPAPPLNRELMTFGLIAILVLFVMATWRSQRLGADTAVDLPVTMRPAELSRRVIAAVIDLVPGMVLAMILFDISNPLRLLTNWVGLTDNLVPLEAAAVVVGVFVLHSILSELFTATTLGKRLAGLEVVNVKGRPPNVWQVLTRNALKAVELLLPLLLLMVLMSPARQRMGDIAGRTVVVRRTSEADSASKNNEE